MCLILGGYGKAGRMENHPLAEGALGIDPKLQDDVSGLQEIKGIRSGSFFLLDMVKQPNFSLHP